jgi:hypothetical protein
VMELEVEADRLLADLVLREISDGTDEEVTVVSEARSPWKRFFKTASAYRE